MTAYRFYVGIDWATEAHRVIVLDADRRALHDRSVRHEGVALETFAHWLAQDVAAGVASDVAVALEVPRGAVVDTLLARGFHVFALNPKQLDRFRDRYTVAGAKDDRRDAQVLASALATDQPAFRRLEPEDPLIVELRELSRLEDDLRHELGRLTNRLREQLHRYFPQLLQLVPAANEPWLWALLERAPTPSAAQHLPRATLRTLLTRHRIRRVDAETVRTLLRTPALAVAPGTVQAARRHLAVLWPRLRLVHQQQAECATLIDGLLERLAESQEHRDVRSSGPWWASGESSPPRCSPRPRGSWRPETITGCARKREWRPSRGRAGAVPSWRCATHAIHGCVTRPTIGGSPPLGMIRSVGRITRNCGPAGTAMPGPYAASSIDCCGSSSPC